MPNDQPEQIVYVDPDGTPTGETAPKLAAHNAHTRLHLAFSCYVFDEEGHTLVTQRAESKKVWPGVWTNTVCGHPLPGETIEAAIKRRAAFELGLRLTHLQLVLPNYTYKTPPFNDIIEHEFCPVYFAKVASQSTPNPEEVAASRWLSWADLITETTNDPTDTWSWWCKDQLKQLPNPLLLAP